MSEPLLLTIEGAAAELACSTRLVEKLIYSGELRSIRLGKRARRVPREAVVEYVARLLGQQDESEVEALPASLRLLTPRRNRKEATHAASTARMA